MNIDHVLQETIAWVEANLAPEKRRNLPRVPKQH
jgi:hypothetical protein